MNLTSEIRNQAIEDAARIVEAYKVRECGPHGYEWVPCSECDAIAAEIRELKTEDDE